jgi:NAD(P)-dependent dehydrogenase (short-subunit alcohol dehydrogenase family)
MSDVKWKVENIPGLSGKVIIVTGANSGVGFEASEEFARKGSKVIMACRNMDKAKDALTQIKEDIPDAPVEAI